MSASRNIAAKSVEKDMSDARPTVYGIARGSFVEIETYNKHKYFGTVILNPSLTRSRNTIEVWCNSDIRMISEADIKSINVRWLAKGLEDISREEIHLQTVLIDTKEKLESFIGLCRLTKARVITEIGLKFFGPGRGRNGTVSWIAAATRAVFIAFDMLKLEEPGVDIWEQLRKPFFENENIIKIFHNARSEADYLFHKQGIQLINVYDTQVVDFLDDVSKGKRRELMVPLYAAILKHIPGKVIEQEILKLKWHAESKTLKSENQQIHPYMERPCPNERYQKYAVVTVKHLLSLKDKLEELRTKTFEATYQEHMENAMKDFDAMMEESAVPKLLDGIFRLRRPSEC